MAGAGDPVRYESGPAAVSFEYAGRTHLRVLGPVTGILYEFSAPGVKVLVDARDAVHLRLVPNLRAAAG